MWSWPILSPALTLRQAEDQEDAYVFLSENDRGFPFIIISLHLILLFAAKWLTMIIIIIIFISFLS